MNPCPFGKIPHATREEALAHQKKLVWKNHIAGQPERSKGLNTYPCPDCDAWHVGHMPSMPLVYHYTIVRYLDRITQADSLRARPRKAYTEAYNEPQPLLWFSWNAQWEHSVLKDPRPQGHRHRPPTGRAITEVAGEGLIRWAAPASVAQLRWNDYLALNPTPIVQRETMARRGNPTDWLATDQPVSLEDCHSFEVYCHGRWRDGADINDEEWETYITERPRAYAIASGRLADKVEAGTKVDDVHPDDDAEAILLDDFRVEWRVEEYKREHADEVLKLQRKIATWQRLRPTYQQRRRGRGLSI